MNENMTNAVKRYLAPNSEHDEKTQEFKNISEVLIPRARRAYFAAKQAIKDANQAVRAADDREARNRAMAEVLAAEDAFKAARAELEDLEAKQRHYSWCEKVERTISQQSIAQKN